MPSKAVSALLLCPMDMDLRLLRGFQATVDHGSVNQAALALHITQPALSRQIKQLEAQLRVSLFARVGRTLQLTRAGEQFLELTRDLLARADSMERAASSIAAGHLNQLHLSVPTTTLTDVIAPFLATFQPEDPIAIVRELDPASPVRALERGADLVVTTKAPTARVASRPIAVLPIWAYVRADDPWADRGRVSVEELVERDLVLMTDRFQPRRLLDAELDGMRLSYGQHIECGNAQVAQAMAAAGRGVAVVSDDPRFNLVPLKVTGRAGPVRMGLFAAWGPTHHAAGGLSAIADRLAEFCVHLYGPEVRAG